MVRFILFFVVFGFEWSRLGILTTAATAEVSTVPAMTLVDKLEVPDPVQIP